MLTRPLFISFEGADACGKTTLSKKVCEVLVDKGCKALRTREPGGTHLAERVRELLLNPPPNPTVGYQEAWDPMAEVMLLNAARIQHTKGIKDWMRLGYTVLADRYVDSTSVYQCVLGGISQPLITDLHEKAVGLWPDITFLVDITEEDQAVRLCNRGSRNRFDALKPSQHAEVIHGFRRLANFTPRIRRVPLGATIPESIAYCLAQLDTLQ